MKPQAARPAPTPTRLLSAIPRLKKRSGNSWRTYSALVELPRSPSSTTTRSSARATSSSASPKMLRSGFSAVGNPAFLPMSMEDLLARTRGLLDVEGPAVKGEIWFVKAAALALDGVGDDDRRLAAGDVHGVELGQQVGNVVTVGLDHAPAEAAPLIHQRLQRHLPADGAGLLVFV